MSTQITTAFVNQFTSNVFHVAQQKGSRLRMAVRNESQKANVAYYERIGAVTAQVKSGRHSDTPQVDTPHSRRAVSLTDYNLGDLFDSADKVRTLIDPTSEYLKAFTNGFGRSMDDVIIAAALGTAYEGVAGATSTVLPSTQKLASVASAAGANMNVQVLRRAKKLLDAAETDPSVQRYLALDANMLHALLGQTETTSSDYNTVKALVQGEIDTFLGFKFIRTERLLSRSTTLSFNTTTGAVGSGSGDANGYKRAIAWSGDGLLLAIGEDFKGRISERADKNYSMQAYMEMSIGATRLEEEKVVEILCATS